MVLEAFLFRLILEVLATPLAVGLFLALMTGMFQVIADVLTTCS